MIFTNNKIYYLLLVISSLFFLSINNYTSTKIKDSELKLSLLKKKLNKEIFISKNLKKINDIFPSYKKIFVANQRKLFNGVSDSMDLNMLQSMVTKAFKKSNFKIISISWGNIIEKNNYKILPILFSVKGNPLFLTQLFNNLLSYNKLLIFKNVSIANNINNKIIFIQGIIAGFKLNNKMKNDNTK